MVKPLEWEDYETSTGGSQCSHADNGDWYFVDLSKWSDGRWYVNYKADADLLSARIDGPSFTSAE